VGRSPSALRPTNLDGNAFGGVTPANRFQLRSANSFSRARRWRAVAHLLKRESLGPLPLALKNVNHMQSKNQE
jgi:hypothetical protein